VVSPSCNRFGHGIRACPLPEEHISSGPYPSRSSGPPAEYERSPPTDLDDHSPLISGRNLELLAGRRDHSLPQVKPTTRAAGHPRGAAVNPALTVIAKGAMLGCKSCGPGSRRSSLMSTLYGTHDQSPRPSRGRLCAPQHRSMRGERTLAGNFRGASPSSRRSPARRHCENKYLVSRAERKKIGLAANGLGR
jgi:hypothetical protein